MAEQKLRTSVGQPGQNIECQSNTADKQSTRVMRHLTSLSTALAFGSILGSLMLFLRKSRESAIFVGLWAPTLLALGILHVLTGKDN